MAKPSPPISRRKGSKTGSSLDQSFKKIVHISSKRENEGGVEYLVKYEDSDDLAWTPDHEVDEDLVKKFETTLSTSNDTAPPTPLRRSGRNKSVIIPPTSDRKRKSVDNGVETKRSRKDTPSPTNTTSISISTSTSTEGEQPLYRGKSILTIDLSSLPKPGEDEVEEVKEEEEEEPKKKKGGRAAQKKSKPKKLPRGGITEVPTPSLEVEESPTQFVSLCVGHASLQGRRATMEDAHAIITEQKLNFVNAKYANHPVHYFAVYDGHGGDKAAVYLAAKLHEKIFKNEMFLNGHFQQTYYNTFAEIDKEVNQTGWGGSTAACVLLVGNTLTVANLGDAEVVLGYKRTLDISNIKPFSCRHGHALLTHNVKPDDGQEARRVEAGGGHVSFGRVNSEVAVSRAFGDVSYKRPTWRTDLISAVPFVNQVELYERDRFLIISCDGLYESDVFTHASAVEFIGNQMETTTDPDVLAKKLAEEAISRGSHDNVTVIVVLLSHE